MISGYRLLVTGRKKVVLMSMVVISTLLQRRGGLYKLEDQWWFVQNGKIKRKLNDPRIEKVTANCSLYYFDDIEEPKNE